MVAIVATAFSFIQYIQLDCFTHYFVPYICVLCMWYMCLSSYTNIYNTIAIAYCVYQKRKKETWCIRVLNYDKNLKWNICCCFLSTFHLLSVCVYVALYWCLVYSLKLFKVKTSQKKNMMRYDMKATFSYYFNTASFPPSVFFLIIIFEWRKWAQCVLL